MKFAETNPKINLISSVVYAKWLVITAKCEKTIAITISLSFTDIDKNALPTVWARIQSLILGGQTFKSLDDTI